MECEIDLRFNLFNRSDTYDNLGFPWLFLAEPDLQQAKCLMYPVNMIKEHVKKKRKKIIPLSPWALALFFAFSLGALAYYRVLSVWKYRPFFFYQRQFLQALQGPRPD